MIQIKEEFRSAVIAFGDNGVSLGKTTDRNLIELGIIAHRSQNPNLLKLFESLPSLEELNELKMIEIIRHASDKKNKSAEGK